MTYPFSLSSFLLAKTRCHVYHEYESEMQMREAENAVHPSGENAKGILGYSAFLRMWKKYFWKVRMSSMP